MVTLYGKDFLNGETLDRESLKRQLAVLSKKPGVYVIQVTTNGKKYVGSSKDLAKRIITHVYNLFKNTHQNILLTNNFQKYGFACFEITAIETEDYVYLETLFLDYLNHNDLSINRSYSGGDVISHHVNRDKIVKKMSESLKERYLDEDYLNRHKLARMGEANPNYKGGASYPRCMWPKRDRSGGNNSFYGKTHSDQVKAAISLANTGRIPPNKGIPSAYGTKLQCGNICFYTMSEACRYFDRSHTWVRTKIRKLDDWFFIMPNDYLERE